MRRFALPLLGPERSRALLWAGSTFTAISLLAFNWPPARDVVRNGDDVPSRLHAVLLTSKLQIELSRLSSIAAEPPALDPRRRIEASQTDAEIRDLVSSLRDKIQKVRIDGTPNALQAQFLAVAPEIDAYTTRTIAFLNERTRSDGAARAREQARLQILDLRRDQLNIEEGLGALNALLAAPPTGAQSASMIRNAALLAVSAIVFTLLGAGCLLFSRIFRQRRGLQAANAALLERATAAESKFRSIFDNAIEGIFHASPDGRFLAANRALAKMYGYSSSEHFMSSLRDIGAQLYVEPEERPGLIRALREPDTLSNFEMEVVRADGRAMWIRENIRAIRDENGRLLFLEGTVADVSDRWWSEQRRRLQYATARVLERASNVAEARPMILQTICEILDWDMGAVWNVNSAAEILQCGEVWHSPDVDITEFEEAVSRLSYKPGQGLAGEVWESGEPKWIADLIQDARTVGARIAINHGMGSAFCVPIKVRGEVQHVVEFFSPKISLPDPELLQTLGVVANQLGHLIERKSAEDALRKSEMRKAAILGSALDCVVSFDIDGHILEFNPAAEQAFGFSAQAALGKDVRDLIAPEELRAAHRPGIALFNAGSLHLNSGKRVEMMAKRITGETFPVEASISRINLDGPPIFTAFLRDISGRKKAARLISELASVVENTNDAVIGCTLAGVIRSWNAGAERIYGWTSDEAVGQSLEILLPEEAAVPLKDSLALVRDGKSLANYEAVHVRKDERKISVSVTDSPVRSERGLITGISSIARDITERKRLEEDLLQSQKMDAVGRLAGGIAHDFNNILTAILGYSDLIISRTDQREWMYKHLTEIRKAADFAASLTHQLLAFSRRQPLFLRVFCINDTVRSMEKMLQRVIGERVRIKTAIHAEAGRLRADPSQLEQVLLNLCVNARDAMPHGGEISILTQDITHVSTEDFPVSEMLAGDYVKLSVSDSGTGIAPDVLKHIFEPFFTTKAEGHGTGLGLATCYGIVKQSGGYITVESRMGKGTTFCIFFPRVIEEVKAEVESSVGDLPGGTETILYVEDELSVRDLTSHVLSDLGYTVLEAANGDGVLRVLEGESSRTIDLLFSDVVLPDVGGRELADLVLEQRPGTRILFTSGYMDDAMLRRHGIEESDAFLQKPFSPADLAVKIRQVMDSPEFALESRVGS